MKLTPRATVKFHKDGTVTVNGLKVGDYRRPDPSGAPHARSPRWVFTSVDQRSELSSTRSGLDWAAVNAAARLERSAR